MVWINNRHINEKAPPGVFGGAICMCEECRKKRLPEPEKSAIEIMQDAQLPNKTENKEGIIK